ncbi:MAG: hypothetical protein MZW92_22135 [Comamonadaceae bacterium]|nr:hypothetical protein [Comamonadaceae bacterium]
MKDARQAIGRLQGQTRNRVRPDGLKKTAVKLTANFEATWPPSKLSGSRRRRRKPTTGC